MAETSPRRARAGDASAVFGVAAIVCLAIPMIGDLLALVPTVAAIVLGTVGMIGHEKGRATRVGTAIVGILLGTLALLGIVILLAASLMKS